MANDRPKRRTREYTGERITVRYDVRRCMHAAECVNAGLTAVFDNRRRPWVDPDGADPDKIVDVVERCPSGALSYVRADGPAESPEPTVIRPQPGGALFVRGDVRLRGPDGAELPCEPRVALCRCGRSKNKPFCDYSHAKGDAFDGSGEVDPTSLGGERRDTNAPLEITATRDGPFEVDGPFTLRSADNTVIRFGDRATLCRCGGSGSKPFCDGTHRRNGFTDPDPAPDPTPERDG